MSVPPPAERFFHNLSCMKEPLVECIKSLDSASDLISADLLDTAFNFIGLLPKNLLFETFVNRTVQHWELIARTDDVRVILDAVLGSFEELGKDRIEEIKNIVSAEKINSEMKTKILNLGKSLVKIGIRHCESQVKISRDQVTPVPTVTLSQIEVTKLLELYGMKPSA